MKMISRFIRAKNKVTIKGETFTPLPLDLEQSIELLLLLAPYVALFENHLSEFQAALKDTEGNRPRLLSALLRTLAGEMKPEDITKTFALLLDKPPEWFRGVRPVELVEALPVLDDVNNFNDIFSLVKELGLTVKYA